MPRKLWLELRSSLWFVPGLLVLSFLGLGIGLVELDTRLGNRLVGGGWRHLFVAGAEGAREVLSTIASSMITVAGVAFSITIVSLSLASSEYTPRVLRNFMRDRANQTVLGLFVGIYVYCLVVLRTIGSSDGNPFLPLLATFGAVLLALAGIGCLIFFIHHTAASIQVSHLLQAITRETFHAIAKLFPEPPRPHDPAAEIADIEKTWHPIACHSFGYLQRIDEECLLKLAKEWGVSFRLEHNVGNFVADSMPLLSADKPLDADAASRLRPLFAIGDFRTVEQDPGFGIRQIVDIALKALSPGINDTSTAVSCLDYLGAILAELSKRCLEIPSHDGRLIIPTPGFGDYLAKALDEIRLSACGNVSVLLQMLQVLGRLAAVVAVPAHRTALIQQATLINEAVERTVPSAYDRERINRVKAHLFAMLGIEDVLVSPV